MNDKHFMNFTVVLTAYFSLNTSKYISAQQHSGNTIHIDMSPANNVLMHIT